VKAIATTSLSRARTAVMLSSLGVLGLALALAGTASAVSNPVSAGTTTLDLKATGVKVKATGGATKSGKSVTLQNTGGSLDPATGAGSVETSGGFKFKNNDGKVGVADLIITFGANGTVNAQVGKKTVDLANITGGTTGRSGFDGTVTGANMKLTSKGAKALNKPLAASEGRATATASAAQGPFRKNKSLGKAGTTTVFTTLEVLAEGETTLVPITTPGSAFVKLAGRGVSAAAGGVAPIAPATVDPATLTFSFPIAGGTLSPTLASGRMNTAGGVRATKTSPRGAGCDAAHPVGIFIQFEDLINDFASKTVIGTVTIPALGTTPGATLSDIDLSGATTSTNPSARTVTVTGAVLRLTGGSANVLSQVFGTGAEGCDPGGTGEFAAGDPLGTLEFTARPG
jgi:hypothetical protein